MSIASRILGTDKRKQRPSSTESFDQDGGDMFLYNVVVSLFCFSRIRNLCGWLADFSVTELEPTHAIRIHDARLAICLSDTRATCQDYTVGRKVKLSWLASQGAWTGSDISQSVASSWLLREWAITLSMMD